MRTIALWHAYHVQDGRSALSQAEEMQVGRSQYPYQIHLVQNYDQLPIPDEVRQALPPNDRSRPHHPRHLVHLVLDCGVHGVLCYVQHVLLAPCRQSNLFLPFTRLQLTFSWQGQGVKGGPQRPHIPSP